MTYEELNPDPFEQPYEYWLMIRNSLRLSEYDKREMLKVAEWVLKRMRGDYERFNNNNKTDKNGTQQRHDQSTSQETTTA